jgi:hypothetical protein
MRTRTVLACLGAAALIVSTVSTAYASVSPNPTRPCAQPDGRVDAMDFSGATLYLGGSFTHVVDRSGVSRVRGGLAAIDTASCDLTSWTANADANVSSLAVSGTKVYVAGSFTHINGITRNRLAAVDASTADVLDFNPNIDKQVNTLLATATKLYVGGEFNKVGGVSRSKLAAFDLPSGTLNSTWQPKANGKVGTFAQGADGADVYIGGSFTTLNGQGNYPYLGAVNASTGANDPTFIPSAGYPILDLQVDARGVYAGGGGHGGHLDIYNLDGTHQQPTYQTDGNVQAVAMDGDSLFAGGHFTNYCVGGTGAGAPFICDQNLERRKALEVSLSSGQLTSWAPAFNSPFGLLVAAVDPATHALWTGGDFTTVNKLAVAHLATFPCTNC